MTNPATETADPALIGPDPEPPWMLTKADLRDLADIAAQGPDAAELVREHWKYIAIQPSHLNRRNGAPTAMATAVRLFRPIATGPITTEWTTSGGNDGPPVTWVWVHIPLRTMRIVLMERQLDVAHRDPRTDEWVLAPVLFEALHLQPAVEITAELPVFDAHAEWNQLNVNVPSPQRYALHAAMIEASNVFPEATPEWFGLACEEFRRIIAGNGSH